MISKRREWIWLSRAVLALVCGVLEQASSAATLAPAPHPNHFVFLIDASGSARKRPAYRQAVDLAISGAYSGFNGKLPPLDPQQDVVTIEQFGCIDAGAASDAYKKLGTVKYFTNFIHPLAVRETGVTAERARTIAFTPASYRLTLLVWAPRLGIAAIAPAKPDMAPANRTFRILVTDWQVNEGSMREELTLINNSKGNADEVDKAKRALAQLDADYTIADALFTQKFGVRADDEDALKVEVCEVRAKSIDAWAANASKIGHLVDGSVEWAGKNDDVVNGVASLTATRDAQSLLLDHATNASMELGGTSFPWSSASAARVPASVAHCAPSPLQLNFSATTAHTDPLLGTVHYAFVAHEEFPLPVPAVCGLPYLYLKIAAVLIALSLIALIIYYIRYTHYLTHVTVRTPTGLVSWDLRWDKPVVVDDIVMPNETDPLVVELPGGIRKWFLYRNAQLLVRSNPPDQFQLGAENQQARPLKALGHKVTIHRRAGQNRAARITVEVQKKKRAAVFSHARPPEGTHA